MSAPRVERDGMVAVIVSPGFGAGWSTWVDQNMAHLAVFAPDVVEWIEAGKPGDTDRFEYYGYTGGLEQAEIVWVMSGTRFEIRDYDGNETLTFLEPSRGVVA